MRWVLPLVVIGLCVCALLGWAVAFYYDRKREKEEDERTGDQ